MLQRITAISILVLLLFNIASRYPAFKFEQWRIRKAVSARIESILHEDELQLVTVAKNSPALQWIRAGKEFRYKGQLYDVVRSEHDASSVTYYCISDEDETQLVAHYEKFIHAQQSSDAAASNKASISLLKIFFSLVYIPNQELMAQLQNNLPQQHMGFYQCSYTDAFASITAPPPKSIT